MKYEEQQLNQMKEYVKSLENDWNWNEDEYNEFFDLIINEEEVETVLMIKEKNYSYKTLSNLYYLIYDLIHTA